MTGKPEVMHQQRFSTTNAMRLCEPQIMLASEPRYSARRIAFENISGKSVHEETDPRPGCANHLRQSFLTDRGN
jgi:hypothetical protein